MLGDGTLAKKSSRSIAALVGAATAGLAFKKPSSRRLAAMEDETFGEMGALGAL